MIYAIYGALGAAVALLLPALGFFAGWKAHGAWRRNSARAAAEEASEEERRQLIEEQKAFGDLMNYSAETAYGMNRGLHELEQGV